MERGTGTKSIGIRCPVIEAGDNLARIVVDSIIEASIVDCFAIRNRDIICLTESIVARCQDNYATTKQIAADIETKFGNETIGVIFPILSRNRFSVCLKGIAMGAKKIVLMLSYPGDEVGNALLTREQMCELGEHGINPYSDTLTLKQYREFFGINRHLYTKVDYVAYYEQIIREAGAEVEIIFANQPKAILDYTDRVLACDIHTRKWTKQALKKAGCYLTLGLDDILIDSIDGSGFNSQYGLLGSNKATESKVKLFPRECTGLLQQIQDGIWERTGKHVEVMVYGDGAFKDPVSGIWELADPEVAPYYTPGLTGTPNELKFKYLADNDFKDLSGDELQAAIKHRIKAKDNDLAGQMASQGTTPRHIVDLVGSLADLTSGSGDKGTPVVLVQGYFDNYAND